VLVLDEPTNHLDLEARRALELALLAFSGAVVLVSHDRHLLRSTAELLLRVGDGRVSPYAGDLENYERDILRGEASPLPRASDTSGEPSGDRREQRRAAAQARRQRRPLEQELKRIDRAMAGTETSLAELDAQLADPELYEASGSEQLSELLLRQGRLRKELTQLEENWLALQEQLEGASAG
jgi:ATP-binding cassette subfamily F protein 3